MNALKLEMGKALSIDHFGARPGNKVSDAAMTASSATLTSASAGFTSGNVGDTIVVVGAMRVVRSNAAMTATSAVLTSSGASFDSSYVGQSITVIGAGAGGANLTCGIQSVDSATQLTLAVAADTTVSGATATITGNLITTISAYTSGTQVTLAKAAGETVSGAVAVYGIDCGAAVRDGLTNCVVNGRGSIRIPSGLWVYTGLLTFQSNTDVIGNGESSILYSASYADAALEASGEENVSVTGVSFMSHAPARLVNNQSSRVLFSNCSNVSFDRIYVDGSASVGVFITGCDLVRGGLITCSLTKADGVHVTGGSTNVHINRVVGNATGDDAFATVSYLGDGAQCEDIVCGFVKSKDSGGRGFGVVGSKNVKVLGYEIVNPYSHGFVVAYEAGFNTYTPSEVKIGSGTITSANTSASYNGFFVGGDASHIVSDVEVVGSRLKDSNQILVNYGSGIRLIDIRKDGGNYRGLLVQNSSSVDTLGCVFSDCDDEALTYDSVVDGEISGNRSIECQTTGSGSRGRFSVLESKRIVGKNNYDFRTNAGATIGPLLVSNTTVPADQLTNLVEVNGHAPGASVGSRVFGLLYDGMRKLLRIENDYEPADESLFSAILKRGIQIIGGPIQIESNHGYRGSGAAAELKLYSGQASVTAEAGIDANFNRSGASGSSTFDLNRNSILQLRVDASGHLLCRGGLKPGLTSSGHGLYAITGTGPEGVVTAPVGSICLQDAGNINLTLWVKVTGSGNTGWVDAALDTRLPSGGSVGQFIQLTSTSPRTFALADVDVGVASNIAATGFVSDRFAYWDGTKFIPKGPADVYDIIKVFLDIDDIPGLRGILDGLESDKSDIGHSHSVSGSTSSDGEPAHSHSVSGSTS